MTFEITRTSDPYYFQEDKKPCEKAYVARRTKEVHRLIPDENRKAIQMVTVKEEPYWAIDIDTLEELMDLVKETEPDQGIIIFGPEDGHGPSLEIYDAYRE